MIPTRKNQPREKRFDKQTYKRRNIIERVVGWYKEYRRLGTRYEKLAVNYVALWLVAIMERGSPLVGFLRQSLGRFCKQCLVARVVLEQVEYRSDYLLIFIYLIYNIAGDDSRVRLTHLLLTCSRGARLSSGSPPRRARAIRRSGCCTAHW